MGALTDEWFKKPYAELMAEAKTQDAIVGPTQHVQNWRPDTCRCELQMVFEGHKLRTLDDKGNTGETFVHNPATDEHEGKVIIRCPFHQQVSPADHFLSVRQENRRKNAFEGVVRKEVPKLEQYLWSFDSDRNLVVEIAGLSIEEKDKVTALLADPKWEGKITTSG